MRTVRSIAYDSAWIGYCIAFAISDLIKYFEKPDDKFYLIMVGLFVLLAVANAFLVKFNFNTLRKFGFQSKADHEFESFIKKNKLVKADSK